MHQHDSAQVGTCRDIIIPWYMQKYNQFTKCTCTCTGTCSYKKCKIKTTE